MKPFEQAELAATLAAHERGRQIYGLYYYNYRET